MPEKVSGNDYTSVYNLANKCTVFQGVAARIKRGEMRALRVRTQQHKAMSVHMCILYTCMNSKIKALKRESNRIELFQACLPSSHSQPNPGEVSYLSHTRFLGPLVK